MDVQKQIRDNTLELHDFLNDLKSWEQTVKERDKKLRVQANQEKPSNLPPIRSSISPRAQHNPSSSSSSSFSSVKNTQLQPTIAKAQEKQRASQKSKGLDIPLGAAGHTYDSYRDKWDKFDVDAALKEVDEEKTPTMPRGNASTSKTKSSVDQLGRVGPLSNPLGSSEPVPDALSEKELGNEFFKEKKFVQAIECYSRSIALRPSAVAYANRAMACIKIRRYKEAESDCTEAIALDDRYVKAYSRRGLARKEMGNFLAAVEDFEFALRLEPQNKELQKQYMEAKALCEKNAQMTLPQKVPVPIQVIGTHSESETVEPMEVESNSLTEQKIPASQQLGIVTPHTTLSVKTQQKSGAVNRQLAAKQQEDLVSTQAVAARAAASAMTALAQKITAPKTSYEFESLWKSFSGDKHAQAELLKSLNPSTLPGLFKDSLTAKVLIDIVCSLEHLLPDHANYAVEILDNLTRVPRFNMTVMCLTTKDKAGLQEFWHKMLTDAQVASELHDAINKLHSKFRL